MADFASYLHSPKRVPTRIKRRKEHAKLAKEIHDILIAERSLSATARVSLENAMTMPPRAPRSAAEREVDDKIYRRNEKNLKKYASDIVALKQRRLDEFARRHGVA